MIPFENELDQLLSQAESLLHEDRPLEALDLLERAKTLEPRHAWTLLFRGVALGQLGRVEEAVDQLIAAADVTPDDIDVQVDAARHLSLLGQAQDALISVNRAVSLDDSDAGAHAVRAEVLERLGRIAEAIPSRETALSLDPGDTDSRYYLAVDLCDLGRYPEAFRISAELIAEFPDDQDIIRLHGACLSYLGRHGDALAMWAVLERQEGLTPNLLHNRASSLDALGQHDEALSTIDAAIAQEPDQGINYYTRGMINEHRGDNTAAINDYVMTLRADPNYLDAAINLVELATITDTLVPALAHLQALQEAHPSSAKLLYARGRLEMELGDFSAAQATLEEAVRREPGMSIGWYTLSALYGMLDDPEAAVAAADRALQEFSEDIALWLNRGQALQELRRFDDALRCYDRVIDLAPEDPTAWLQIGRLLLLELERPADARGALRETLRLQPDNPHARWMLSLCYLRLGRLGDATDEVTHLLRTHPTHLWGRLVQAALHTQRGAYHAALDDLRIAAAEDYDLRLLSQDPLFTPLWEDPEVGESLRALLPNRA